MANQPVIKGQRLLRLLGEGGMGSVYLAEDEALGRRTAIKVISDKVAGDTAARARFLREARSMATVEHPHVVRVYSFGEAEGTAYIVMEYVEGEVLGDRIKRLGRVPVDEAVRIVREVVDALEAAWDKRLVHRDIKPSNILLDAKGCVRVADFGLAKPIQAESDASLTATGSILGTPHYVSPEQATGRDVDFRSDIYSLGIVLYEMLAGHRPYEGTTPFEVVAKHIHGEMPPLRTTHPEVPVEVAAIVEWMTAKSPGQRPQSYAELRARLSATAAEEPPTEVVATTTGVPTHTTAGTAQRGRARGAILAAAFLALAVAWFARRPSAPSGYELTSSGILRATPPAAGRLVVAVTPFYGPDEDSAKEGKVMAALVERAIGQRLKAGDVKVLGVEETKQPVRDHAAALALGERLGATVVVWGDSFVLHGETEIHPYLTMVRRKASPQVSLTRSQSPLGREPLEALSERAGGSVLVGVQAPNQIELRKTGAAGVGDLVLVLAGTHALYTEGKPEKALALFEQAPRTPESLRHQAEALGQLRRAGAAQKALEEATVLDPKDAQACGMLGDLHIEAGRLEEAVAAYRRAADTGRAYSTRQAILFEGKLYAREYRTPPDGKKLDSGYLLGLDPATGVVAERHRLPGTVRSLTVTGRGIEIAYMDYEASAEITLSAGRFDRPLFYGSNLRLRRNGDLTGSALAANFLPDSGDDFKPHPSRDDAPKTLPEVVSAAQALDQLLHPVFRVPRTFPDLEAALRRARARDPTQPWHLFFLGQALWWQGHREEAEKTWREMFAGEYPAIPYYEYARMAASFEEFGQQAWADRAHGEWLRRRKQLPTPVGTVTLIERLIYAPFVSGAAARLRAAPSPDAAGLDRAHLWLARARELGPVGEGEDFAAAAWAHYYRDRGDRAKADAEAAVAKAATTDPLNLVQHMARWDYAFQLHLATALAFWVTLVTLLFAANRRRGAPGVPIRAPLRPGGGVPFLSRGERRVLSAAGALVLATIALVALLTQRLDAVGSLPIGFADSLGGPYVLRSLEDRVRAMPVQATRFAAAVANHVAGHTDRARELYQSLAEDLRAQKDLEALQTGSLLPPEPLRPSDLYAAYATLPVSRWINSLWQWDYMVTTGVGRENGWLSIWPSILVGNALLTLWLGLVFLVLPLRAQASLSATAAPPGRTRIARSLVPGLRDLLEGKPLRGFTTLAPLILAGLAVAVHLAASGSGIPCVGPLTAISLPSVGRAFPMPSLPYWPLFWTYADAPLFWGVVVLGLALSLILHVRSLRSAEPARAAPAEPLPQTLPKT